MRRWGIGSLAFLTLLLAGCFRYDAAITVNEDGTGNVVTLMAAQDAVLKDLVPRLIQNFGGNPLTDLKDSDLPPGGTVKPYKQDGFTGITVNIPFPAEDDLSQNAQFAMGTAAGIVPSPIDEFLLKREKDGWHFRAFLVDGSTFVGQDITNGPGKDSMAGASYNLRLKLPGHVVRSNADEVKNGQLVWHIDLTAKKGRTIEAISQLDGIRGVPSVGIIWLFSILGGAVLMVAGTAVQVWRMR